VFVQDHHWSSDPIPALMRLSGIVIGIVVLAAVMLGIKGTRLNDARTAKSFWP
jgi:hypothetical protein